MHDPNSELDRLARGAIAGAAATVPMTAAMLLFRRALPRSEQYALEPWIITERILQRVGLKDDLTSRQEDATALAAHFAYGATAGAVGSLMSDSMQRHPALFGAGYGAAVWAGSYVGWLPAMRILAPPQERPLGRDVFIVATHLVWGAALGLFLRGLTRRP